MKLTKGLIKADIIAARQAINYYEEYKIRDIKNIAAYHLQQATEKLIKYQIYEKCGDIDESQIYTHNIDKLIAYSEKEVLTQAVEQSRNWQELFAVTIASLGMKKYFDK